jgi:hypothetical protein
MDSSDGYGYPVVFFFPKIITFDDERFIIVFLDLRIDAVFGVYNKNVKTYLPYCFTTFRTVDDPSLCVILTR